MWHISNMQYGYNHDSNGLTRVQMDVQELEKFVFPFVFLNHSCFVFLNCWIQSVFKGPGCSLFLFAYLHLQLFLTCNNNNQCKSSMC